MRHASMTKPATVDEAQSNADLVVAGFDLAFYGLRRSGSPGGAVRNGGSGSNCDIATVQKMKISGSNLDH